MKRCLFSYLEYEILVKAWAILVSIFTGVLSKCFLPTGQVYRLRNPSTQYLASLSNYDSSNPTKNWRFPQMSISREIKTCSPVTERYKPISTGLPGEEDVCLPLEISAAERVFYVHFMFQVLYNFST